MHFLESVQEYILFIYVHELTARKAFVAASILSFFEIFPPRVLVLVDSSPLRGTVASSSSSKSTAAGAATARFPDGILGQGLLGAPGFLGRGLFGAPGFHGRSFWLGRASGFLRRALGLSGGWGRGWLFFFLILTQLAEPSSQAFVRLPGSSMH